MNFKRLFLAIVALLAPAVTMFAGEEDLVIPNLSSVSFLGVNGTTLLLVGLAVCALGFLFGFLQFLGLKKIKVHESMSKISELIYSTCRTYLLKQGRFILILEVLVIGILISYFGFMRHYATERILLIIGASLVGILGSFSVAWFGMRINTYANSRCAFRSLTGSPYPVFDIPLRAGMSIGMMLISMELILMLAILLFVDPNYAGFCFLGFAIGESLSASVLRIAGGIFTKIADIGSDLMKIVFNVKEDDARNPGVIADCTGDNAGDSVGPTADGFETYGVTGVALISFILLAVRNADPQLKQIIQVQLLVWIFMMRIVMILASGFSYMINDLFNKIRYGKKDEINFESPLHSLVWITSIVSVVLTFVLSRILIPGLGDGTLWYKLSAIISLGTIAGALIPEIVKKFTSTDSHHVQNILHSSRSGGASLNILSGITTGNFSAYWIGIVIIGLMSGAYLVSQHGLSELMLAPSIFAFGLVAFGFLSMGPVTIAVDSYGPVADNAQSIYELSLIEKEPNISKDIETRFGFTPNFKKAKQNLESNDGAGNTFKATAKPVLIGTAVVGSTTMIFSIIMILTRGLTANIDKLSILYPPFFLGLIAGGALIYWFTGATTHAVTTGAYHAVEFIKKNMKINSGDRASTEDSNRVVGICTDYAQMGMVNLFMALFFSVLAFACLNSYFFIGFLIALALVGLFQAIYMANAGGAWDNAKKLVEVELMESGTELHDATIVGDTIGDPFKDTTSVSLNPVIKFSTLFGLLAVELALMLNRKTSFIIAAACFAIAVFFVVRSFHEMRIRVQVPDEKKQ